MAIFSLLADASPSPIDTDLGKLVIGLAFLFLVADRIITLFFRFLPGKAEKTYVNQEDFKLLEGKLDTFVTKTDATAWQSRLEKQLGDMALEYKELTKFTNARYEDLNRQNNEIRLSIETQRREAIELNHRAVAEVVKKIDDVDYQNRTLLQAAFEHANIPVPPAFKTPRGGK